MVEKKTKKTLTISTSKPYNISNYKQQKGKTSVVVEKKVSRRWNEKKPQSRVNDFNRTKPKENFFPKKPPINRNYDIRKIAEERATKRFKSEKENLKKRKIKILIITKLRLKKLLEKLIFLTKLLFKSFQIEWLCKLAK